MAININSYSSLNSKNGMEGLMSGLETSEIIKAYTTTTRNKITAQEQKKQVTLWKQEMYQEITSKMTDYYNKYFSYSSSSCIFNSSFYDTSSITSSSSKVSVSGDSEVAKNMQIGSISSLATASTFTSTHKLSTQTMTSGVIDEADLAEKLSGTNVTVTYNGISKQINFNESDKDQFSTVEGLKNYIQDSLDSSFGNGKVNVSLDEGKLSFATSDSSSIFTINNASTTGILGKDGALKLVTGESNRAELTKTLDDIASTLTTPLTKDSSGNYSININGVDFSFTGDTLFGDVIDRINNNDEANVTISYSSITDSLSIKSDVLGASNPLSVSSSDGSNLAEAMFGVEGVDYNIKQGTDFVASMSFDGGNTFTTVTRTTNAFNVDGVDLSFTGTTEPGDEPISFDVNPNVDKLAEKITTFVNEYNEILDWIQTKLGEAKYGKTSPTDTDVYLPLTEEQEEEMTEEEIEKWNEKAKTGLLRSDSTLYQISNNLRRAMNDLVGDTGLGLYQFGIQTSSDYTEGGKLVIDQDKLKASLAEKPEEFEKLFTTSEEGLAYKVKNVLQDAAVGNAKGDGILVQIAGKKGNTNYQSSISLQITNINSRLSTLKTLLQNEEDRWWNKFSTLESYISNMNSQFSIFTGYTEG